MDNFWDLLFQLMKQGTNTLHFAFTFFFSVENGWPLSQQSQVAPSSFQYSISFFECEIV